MRHKVAGRKLSRATDHRMALYRNLVTDLLRYEKIVTTEAKAKEARSLAEKMITLGKRKNLNARRQALAFVYDKDVVDKLFTELDRGMPRGQEATLEWLNWGRGWEMARLWPT